LKAMAFLNIDNLTNAYSTLSYINSYFIGNLFADKAKLELAIIELARKQYDLVSSLLTEVIKNRKDEIGAKAQYFLGVNYYEQNKIDDAITALVRVRSVFAIYDEWFTRSLLKLGDCYLKLNDKKKARDMFSAVKKNHPNNEFGQEANQKLKGL